MILQITPYTIALILTSSVTLLLAGFASQRRSTTGWVYFVLAMLSVAWWSLAYALELSATEMPIKLFWNKASYVGALSIPACWFLFAIYYQNRPGNLQLKRQAAVFVLPMVFMALAFTNELHGLVWQKISLITTTQGSLLVFTYGPIFWANCVYAYTLMLVGSVLLGRGVLRTPKIFRKQKIMLLSAAAVPWLSNLLYLTGMTPIRGVDLTPLAFAISGILISSAIFRYHLLELMPVAYDVLFASMENEAFVLDAQGRLLEANPAARRMFGLCETHIGLQAKTWLQQYPELECIFHEDGNERCEVAFMNEGTEVWRSVQVAPLINRHGSPCGKLIVLSDVTQRKFVEEQLNQAHQKALEVSRMKTRLLANISHDLRSPLTAVLGFSELLRSEVLGEINPQQRTALENIQESANQQLAFVNNLIGQAQLETGRIILNHQHFHAADLVESILVTANAMASRKGLTLIFSQAPGLPELLYGDPYWLRQILANLVNNAVKFTQQGEVKVLLYLDDADRWALQVCDTGVGISAEKLRLIFEPFRQLQEGRATQTGSGLGLSIVKQLVDLMNGVIEVESAPGAGSTFTVTLPYRPPVELQPSHLAAIPLPERAFAIH
jgi:PAS domain S-box-containing protein